jgi:hypothetical protein
VVRCDLQGFSDRHMRLPDYLPDEWGNAIRLLPPAFQNPRKRCSANGCFKGAHFAIGNLKKKKIACFCQVCFYGLHLDIKLTLVESESD